MARGLNKSQCMDCQPGQKKGAVVERLFWQLGTCFSGQRFKQGPMYGLSAGTKKVAVVERWPLGRVPQYKRWLYILLGMLANELSVTGRFANVMAPIVRTLDSAVYAPDKSQSGRYVY